MRQFKKGFSWSRGLSRGCTCVLGLLVSRGLWGKLFGDSQLLIVLHQAAEPRILPVDREIHQQPAPPIEGAILVLWGSRPLLYETCFCPLTKSAVGVGSISSSLGRWGSLCSLTEHSVLGNLPNGRTVPVQGRRSDLLEDTDHRRGLSHYSKVRTDSARLQ